MPEYITVEEVSQLLGVKPRTIRTYVQTGRILAPDLRPTTRAMLWQRARFFEWLTAQAEKREAANA